MDSDVVGRRNREIGAFVRSRRERLDPACFGFARSPRRRAKGLKREELSFLSGLSTAWITFIEQGRARNVSGEALRSLGAAMQLTATELDYLLLLAEPGTFESVERDGSAFESLRRFADDHVGTLAAVSNVRGDFVYGNRLFRLLLPYWGPPGSFTRNSLWLDFFDPYRRVVHPEWHAWIRFKVQRYRTWVAYNRDIPGLDELLAELSKCPEFVELWAHGNVNPIADVTRHELYHGEAGVMPVHHFLLTLPTCPVYFLSCFVPEDDETAVKLMRLGKLPEREA